MVEIISYNPAGVVDRLRGRGVSASPGLPDGAEPKVSAASRQRALQGDPTLSFETQQAVARGAQPPVLLTPKEPPATASEITNNEGADLASAPQQAAPARPLSSTPAASTPAAITLGAGATQAGQNSGGLGQNIDISV